MSGRPLRLHTLFIFSLLSFDNAITAIVVRRNVHLLSRVPDFEPGEVVDAVGWHGARGQAQGGAVEVGGVVEGAWGDEEVDVGEGGDHFWFVW
jgi:hypothetical protein